MSHLKPGTAYPLVHLLRVDPARNMCRFYKLDVQPDLFGGVALVKEWGRIGRGGQVRSVAFDDPKEALVALEATRRAKVQRGYLEANIHRYNAGTA